MSKKFLTAALAALSLSACTDASPPAKSSAPVASLVKARPQPVIPDVLERHDAGAPVTLTPPVEAPIDPLVVAHERDSVDHLKRSTSLASEGDVKGALLEARRALFTTPTDVDTLTQVARLARRAGQPELAAEAWGRVAQSESDDAIPLVQQARAFLAMKDHARAEIAGRQAIERDSGNVEAFQVTGLAQLAQTDLPSAIASFKKAVELDPKHGWALNNLGLAYLRANENERAVEVLTQSAELLPTVAYVHNNLGVALERVGRDDEAKSAYQQAMDLSPKYVKARLNADRVARVRLDAPEPDETPDSAHPLTEEE